MVINGIAVCNEVQFRSKSLVCYQSFHKTSASNATSDQRIEAIFAQSTKFQENVKKLKKTAKYTGEMTAGAKKRLTKAISLLVQSAPEKWIYNPITKKNQHHKISFITLTLPNVEATKDAKFCHKELLQPMLRILRNKYKMQMYVWKCELQKNESIHYHITTELFMPWDQLRQHWNAILSKNGLLEAFQKQYGHDNPNSVDIHSVNKINDLEAYLVKYVSKEYQNTKKLDGKIWDCSKNLKEAKYFTTTLTHELHQQILKEIDLGWLEPIYRDRCVIIRSRTTDYYQSFSKSIINDYYSHITKIPKWQKQESTKRSKSTKNSSIALIPTSMLETATRSKISTSSVNKYGQTLLDFHLTVYGKC